MTYKFFTLDELKCSCGKCGSTGDEMDAIFMRKIDLLRGELGFPFPVTSAYRCPEYNKIKSTTGLYGPHTTGRAIDIAVSHERAYKLIQYAPSYGFTGIGVNQKGSKRFIHLDMIDGVGRPTVWSY